MLLARGSFSPEQNVQNSWDFRSLTLGEEGRGGAQLTVCFSFLHGLGLWNTALSALYLGVNPWP